MDRDEFNPQWPQRPENDRPAQPSSQPRLDPPTGNNLPRREAAPSSWTSHPAQNTADRRQPSEADETKATRALPLVDTGSRFAKPGAGDQGSGIGDQGLGARRADAQPLARSTPVPQAQAQPRPTPQREDVSAGGYEEYQDPIATYRPEANPRDSRYGQGAPRSQAPVQYAPTPRTKLDTSRSYLSVEVEGEKKRRFGAWILWLMAGIILVALIGGTAFALAWQGQYSGKMYAGVRALGIDLGGKTPEEAEKLLRDKVKAFSSEPVVLAWAGKEWKPSLEDLGVTIGVDETVDDAFKVGRDADFFGSIADQWTAAQSGWQVALTVELSEPALQSYLDGIAETEIDQALFEGDVRLNGTQIEALPGKEGRYLDTYQTIGLVRGVVSKLEAGQKIDLPVKVVQPTVSAAEVEEVQKLLALRISQPITARTLDKEFTLDPEALIRFTTIERNPDRSAAKHIQLGWIDHELDILADKWVTEANRQVINARFAWQNGTVAVLTESVNGFETDQETVVKAIKEHADKAEGRQFDLPGKTIEPTVSSKDLPSLGITGLMGTGTSTFKGSSQERATNIRVAAGLLNGAVVPPGGTFSFLQTMGGIDEAHGFVEGYVIQAERTQRGVGGGVCQVSTTMFRAAFFGGMEVTERNEHSYRVGWYEANGEPVGFDAAVFDPGVDLKFVNNSPHYVLVEAVAGADLLTVNMYGTKPVGEVKLEGPVITNRQPAPPDVYEVDTRLPPGTKKQVETARSGLTTSIMRRIITPGQPDKVDEFKSTYLPWPNMFIVASESQIPRGARVAPQAGMNP
ncbi:MAG: VanW family protein [Chloroflexia bacterium]